MTSHFDQSSLCAQSKDKPLITFLILSFNQEKYINEAIDGALAQTYSPLQVIISDDCSNDGTYRYMEEKVAAYQGPHSIILNRSTHNLGISEHINQVMALAKGELIVAAAGDDISLSHRVEAVFAAWERASRAPCVVYSNAEQMNENGQTLGQTTFDRDQGPSLDQVLSQGVDPGIVGCTEAWHKSLFDIFGPLRHDVVNEDGAIWFRAALLGKVIHVPKILVRHRLHANNMGSGGLNESANDRIWAIRYQHAIEARIAVTRNHLADLATIRAKAISVRCLSIDLVQRILNKRLMLEETTSSLLAARGLTKAILAVKYLRYCNADQRKILPLLLWPRSYRRIRRLLRKMYAGNANAWY